MRLLLISLIVLLTSCTTVHSPTNVYVDLRDTPVNIDLLTLPEKPEMKKDKEKTKKKDKKPDDELKPQGGGRTPPPRPK